MNIPDMSSQSIRSFCSWAWQGTKQASLMLEPYQPAIAGSLILGKLIWRLYKHRTWTAEANALSRNIRTLNVIASDQSRKLRGAYESYSPPSREELSHSEMRIVNLYRRIDTLENQLKEKRSQLNATAMTCWQIPSLLFPHPGANLWNSTYQIFDRGVRMREQVHDQSLAESWTRRIANFTGGVLSLAGTTASLLRQQGYVSKENQTSHVLIGLALGVHAIEGILMAKNAIASLWKDRT